MMSNIIRWTEPPPKHVGAHESRRNTYLYSRSATTPLERIHLGLGTHDEGWLQALILDNPELLSIAQLEPAFGQPIPVAREVPCGHGYIDNLYITPSGDIVMVEAKLWRNGQARREVGT
jgi:hypothetical protein